MSYRGSIPLIIAVVIGLLALPGCGNVETPADAQGRKCTTVIECAQQAVEIATKMNETVKMQQQEIDKLRNQLQNDLSSRPKNIELKDCAFEPWTNYNNGKDMACPAGKVLRAAKLGAENFSGANNGSWRMMLECCSVGFAK